MTNEGIGDWIKSARAARGWNQERLGEAVGVSKANVSHWETGKHEPSFNQLLRIRDVTGYALRDVGAAAEWPLPMIGRERITSLNAKQLEQVQLGLIGLLAAVADSAELGKAPCSRGMQSQADRRRHDSACSHLLTRVPVEEPPKRRAPPLP